MRMTLRQAIENLVLSGNILRNQHCVEIEWLMLLATLPDAPRPN